MTLKMSENREVGVHVTSCSYCERKFSRHKALYVHMRKFHKDKPVVYKQKSRIICSTCDEEHKTVKAYWDHIHTMHPEVTLSFEKVFFYSEEDFNKWKIETEARTQTHFSIVRSQVVLSDGSIVQQLECNRSGFHRSSGASSRRLSSKSKKIGKFCPAYIYRKKTVVDDLMEIEVDFQSTHMGHKLDVHSLRICSEQQERRLKSQGKGRWPQKLDNPPPSQIAHSVNVDEDSRSYIKQISDILHSNPNLAVQNVLCNCLEYQGFATCDHVQTILLNLSEIEPMSQKENNAPENSRDMNSSCAEADYTTIVAGQDLVIPVENVNMKSLENEKGLVLQEFQQVVNVCENWPHLQEVVIEGERYLSSLPSQESTHSLSNINNVYLISSMSEPSLSEESTSGLHSLSLPYENNFVLLQEGMTPVILN